MPSLKNIARFLVVACCPRIAYPVLSGPLKGARFVLGSFSGEGGGVSVYLNRCETAQTEALARALRKGDVFFDIGANVGYYTILGSRCVGPGGAVVSFEPAVRNIAYLHRHISINKADNVTVLPSACSEDSSIVLFSRSDDFALGHIVAGTGGWAKGANCGVSLAQTVSVDALCDRVGIRPDVMKIDVEGAEAKVLRGSRKTLEAAAPKIFLSVHSGALRDECLDLLRSAGYGVSPIGAEMPDAREYFAAR